MAGYRTICLCYPAVSLTITFAMWVFWAIVIKDDDQEFE